jgi:hypothetical protein
LPTVNSHQTVRLTRGMHHRPEDGVCVMELVSMLAGEPFSDEPGCACPVLAAVLRASNDRFDDAARQRLYRYAAAAVDSRGDQATIEQRIALCVDAVRARAAGAPWWRSRALARFSAPRATAGYGLERFGRRAVRFLARGPRGADEVLALVDKLLAVGSPDPRVRVPATTATSNVRRCAREYAPEPDGARPLAR